MFGSRVRVMCVCVRGVRWFWFGVGRMVRRVFRVGVCSARVLRCICCRWLARFVSYEVRWTRSVGVSALGGFGFTFHCFWVATFRKVAPLIGYLSTFHFLALLCGNERF
jgi:hypothetical protein